jgi:hypothetical protein
MRMLKAIARVRRGAKDNGLEGALSSLGSELRSDAIPERLRDAAARLATLLSPKGVSADPRPSTKQVVSLEQALEAKSAPQPGHVPTAEPSLTAGHAAGHAAEGVCPFTGLRADGTSASLAASSDPTLDLSPAAQVAKSSAPTAPAARARKPRVRSQGRVEARGGTARETNQARGTAREQSKHDGPGTTSRPPKAREKDKEKLAGSRPVENTSARSATRSAPKQPRSRTQRSRKKA